MADKTARMCVACRVRRVQPEFIRVSRENSGRGAYVCENSDCIVNAIKKRSFDRALRGKMNILTTLGLCKRAGKLVTGFDSVVSELRKSAGVLIASDLSDKSKKEIAFHCEKAGKKLVEIEHTMDEIAGVLNKKTGIIAVMDSGLFKSIIK
jgi:ribosomal protein L7Ae-like RNA K-turn-binding protein